MSWQYRCLELGGDEVITADTQEELIEKVNRFLRENYDSFELEDVILAGAEQVDRPEPERPEASRTASDLGDRPGGSSPGLDPTTLDGEESRWGPP